MKKASASNHNNEHHSGPSESSDPHR